LRTPRCPQRGSTPEELAVTQNYTVQIEPEQSKRAEPLVERLDPAIGEATSMMGTVLTELLRRSLRGGVLKLGEELHAFAAEKVETALADKAPALEQKMAEVAEHTARSAATEIAVEEVKQLEQRTTRGDQDLAAQIEATARGAQVGTAEAARDLTTRIDEAEKQTKDIILDTARGLAHQITEAEKRVSETARSELNQQIEHLLQRSRKGVAVVEARIKTVEETAADLGKRLLEEQDGRKAEHSALRTEVQEGAASVRKRLEQEAKDRQAAAALLRQELVRSLEEGHARQREEIAGLLRANQALAARVVELEKPRGLRALWARLFGRRKQPAPARQPKNGADKEEVAVAEEQ
jgi:hypothetical protein